MKGLAIFATVALSAFAFAGCRHEARYVTVDGAMLGTTFHVVARTDRSPKGKILKVIYAIHMIATGIRNAANRYPFL